MRRVDLLRKKHPRFVYRSFDMRPSGQDLKITFDFILEPNIRFRPQIIIKNVPGKRLGKIGDRALQNFAFHLGLIEIPSYWKAACTREVMIEAGHLNSGQIRWWKDLFTKGLGQFFYENGVNFRKPNFIQIKTSRGRTSVGFQRSDLWKLGIRNRYVVPVGGGKDSIVTIEKLKKQGKEVNAFLVNPTKDAKRVTEVAGIKNPIIVERKIDPKLLGLNKGGYLNGHTPFTAVLSFLSVFCAVLFDYRHIAFSNEKSANEGNLRWNGMVINHQYSKSSEFEKKFSWYCKKYLAKNVHYFSFLRRYGELEISKMFARYTQYFPVFASCNTFGKLSASRGKKTVKRWCGECPKCLFVYMTLYPHLRRSDLRKIFGKDLFDSSIRSAQGKKRLQIMKALIDSKRPKPFECVGTKKESRRAFLLCLRKARKQGKPPYVLARY